MFWFFLASCSAILSAVAAIIQKKVLFRLTALEFSFLVSLIILIFTLFIPFSIDVTSVPHSALFILIGKSILGGAAFLMVMLSLQHNQISSALPLLGMTPAATALLAILFLGESLHQWEWAGIGLMMAGTYLLEKKPGQQILQPFKNMMFVKNHQYIFAAVGLFAISTVLDKLLIGGMKIDPRIVLFYQHIIYCIIFGSLLWIRKSSIRAIVANGKEHLLLLTTVAVVTIAYRYAQLEATKLAPVALVLAVKRTSILYASFFGGKIFSDDRLSIKLAGASLIVGAGFVILRYVV
jgi:drug/metabolite transporter (DMT)-like permease